MLFAITVAGVTIHLLSPYGTEGLFAASIVSLGIGGLLLVATINDRASIIRTCLFAAFGWIVGEFFRPVTMGLGPSSLAEGAIPVVIGVVSLTLFGSLAYRVRIDETIPGSASNERDLVP